MDYILAIDEGTTGCRAILFDRSGQIKQMAYKEFTQHYPEPGMVEHDPLEIWETQLSVINEALKNGGISPHDVKAIGITNQRETTVVWDRKTGKPVYNAIVWQDRRTAPLCDKLKQEGKEEAVTSKTGLRLDPYFSATKLRWILDKVPDGQSRAEKGELAFGTIDSWLIWNLTGGKEHLIEMTNASRTLLFNIHTKTWDEELLQLFKIPSQMLPRVCSSSEIYANTDYQLFAHSIPIAGCAGDQQASLFGQRCTTDGAAKITYGTGCFLLMHTGAKPVASQQHLLTTIASQIGNETSYALEGSVFIGGAVVQWLRDELKIIKTSAEVEQLASSVVDNGGVFFVPAFSGLGAPYWDPYARGTLFGLTRGSNSGHIARAALEAIAYQSADVIHAMEADAKMTIRGLKADGGASQNSLLMQFQSDILNKEIVTPQVWETSALGAAFLAGLATGYWASVEEIDALDAVEKRFQPAMNQDISKGLLSGWKRAVEHCLLWSRVDTAR